MELVSHTHHAAEPNDSHCDRRDSGFDLNRAIDSVSHWLPTQGPLKDFIHHNTLHAVQHLPFHEGVALAAKIFGARSYLPLSDYQNRYREGRISDHAIDWALQRSGVNGSQRQALRDSLFSADKQSHYPPISLANHGVRTRWLSRLEVDLNALVHPVLFRLLANFLDQGISRWSLPKADESFWDCVLRLTQNSLLPLYPFQEKNVRDLLTLGPDQVILHCLQRMVGVETWYEQYLLEMLLGHPGWSGMVRLIELNPQTLLARRDISLKQLIAFELACELAFLRKKRGVNFSNIAGLKQLDTVPRFNGGAMRTQVPLRLKVWHEAMEWSLHSELLQAIKHQPAPGPSQTAKSPVQAQALFCIDDRECSLRRHLEETNPGIQTFGAVGFFGIDFLYQGLDDVYPVAQCPTAITPKHLIVEAAENQPETKPKTGKLSSLHFTAHSMLRGWLFTQTLGLGYAARLAWNVFRPGAGLLNIEQLSEVKAHSHLHLLRETDEPTPEGYLLGFSFPEMADRVGGLLRNIGLTKDFAPLVVIVAHGSSSVNNPHFAAYDCGACAGKPGAPNARAFAWMANQQPVRDILRERGIDIPADTYFVPALHNTSRDEITYFDPNTYLHRDHKVLHAFKHDMHHALLRNARERCRWFELGPQSHSNKEAHQHVVARASSIFEPRPEYNHSNNLYCLVGRRELSRHLFMDRRSFLHSYAPDSDTNGEILTKILSAIIPVCGGINLEYLFSRIDNSVYGAGTKLPHNVIGLLGVANGVEGDLRTGLPSQMIEVHEPARLLMIIEQATGTVDKALAAIGGLREWLDGEWIRLASYDPASRDMKLYTRHGWESIELPESVQTPAAAHSEKIIVGKTATIPVHQLLGRHA
ncbi:YbcC family protein [Methylomonas koyamae]|uniref:YbcC family protein n=1 Tax=Methylomonas koyamae TaxID=702114 RepID=UPI001C328161|nr:DUF2309 domain-containing protein [Methylomonas koyamae]BBL57959.1 hypothetical protein MKFW12EY_15720 [Methylomonas koyamae]